ncbi:MAG: MarR family transcriptional regulator [Proteobacteria bacterium]|nr:MarR family transcriptional regulator [Pseudomonadota bacterium]
MPASPLADRCAAEVRRTVSQLSRKLRPSLQRDGISMAKLSVIGQVHRAGRISPTELAAHEGVRLQTLTRLLAELEADGWLLRTPHETDGRQSLLSLTAQGKKRLADAARASDASLAQAIGDTLDPEDQAALLRACKLLDRLDAALSGKTVRPAGTPDGTP